MMASASRSTARVKSAREADTAVTTRCTSTGALDLQTVGTVVPDGIGIEEFVEIGDELKEIHDRIVPQNGRVYGGITVRIASTLRLLCLPGVAASSMVSCTPAEAAAGRRVPRPSSDFGRPQRTLGTSGRERSRSHRRRTRRRCRPVARHGHRPIKAHRLRNLARDGIDLVFCVGPEVEAAGLHRGGRLPRHRLRRSSPARSTAPMSEA